MANPSISMSHLDKLKRWMGLYCWMGASSVLENVIPLACESKHATTSSMTSFPCVHSKNLIIEKKVESGKGMSVEDEIEQSKVHWSQLTEYNNDLKEVAEGTSVEDEIEQSKVHWSQLTEYNNDNDLKEVAEVNNVEVFKELQWHPTWGHFFRTFDDGGAYYYEWHPTWGPFFHTFDNCRAQDYGKLVVGEKFAEVGQAELYHAHVTWDDPQSYSRDQKLRLRWVLKVFKKGTFLRDLQKQLPLGLFRHYEERVERHKLGKSQPIKYTCEISCMTLLPDGRFGFLLVRETGDLRALIDHKMKAKTSHDFGPFPIAMASQIIYIVAKGMDRLHNLNIVHRDLKASNVLYAHFNKNNDKESYEFYVADFECSIGVVGTGFFRAPEILQALKDKVVNKKPNLFSKASDVYSYGMVCYEILTGKLPFEGHPTCDFDLVLSGQQPKVPHHVDKWARDLLRWCWQFKSVARPTFREILSFLEANSKVCKRIKQQIEQREMLPWELQKDLVPIYEF